MSFRVAGRAAHRNETSQEWQLQDIILQKRTEATRLEIENQQILRQQQALVSFIRQRLRAEPASKSARIV